MSENNIALELVIGVPRAPGDNFTNEPELETINLLNVSGFAVRTDGWTPQLPSMKNGGLWADSALSAGRQLIAGEVGNVTETITLVSTGATLVTHLYLKSRLLQFAQRAKAFHTDWSEQQPVYLKWQAPGSQIAQYAIVYSIDAAPEDEAFEGDNLDTVVITVEREPAWRMGVPPGGNPKLWTFFSRGMAPGTEFQYDDMALDGSDSLVTGAVANRHEWTYNGGAPVVTPTSKNYLEITAAQIPGDAPALVCAGVRFSPSGGLTTPLRRLLMWSSSKELSGVDQVIGTPMAAGYIMNAADMTGTGATPTAGTASTGVFNTAAVPAKQFMLVATGGTGSVVDVVSGSTSGTTFSFWWRQLMRGRYAVFVRATALTGVATDVRLTVSAEEWNAQSLPTANTQIVLPTLNVPVNGAGSYSLLYAGQLTIPFEAKSHVGIDGRGLYLKNFVNNVTPIDFRLKFHFENFTSPTAARNVHMLDAILVPMDEGFTEFRNDDVTLTANAQTHILDNTGYLARGKPDDIGVRAINATFVTNKPAIAMEQRGSMPTLLPRKTQRLYFLNVTMVAGLGPFSVPDADMNVFINIVPRCYGVAAL